MTQYDERIEQELAGYREVEEVHQLPPIYHYWSQRWVLPLLQDLGHESLDGWWDDEVAKVCRARAPAMARMVGLGAGNGDLETGMAARLAQRGIDNLEVVLLELNPAMLERALAHAERLGVADRIQAATVDLNRWKASEPADIYVACHSLHHVVELEHLFDEVAGSLAPDGVLLVNDMVGRNGHRRWPEAAGLVEALWRAAAPRHRRNNYTGGLEDVTYPDIDCSNEGFEGVRAQDVLPLLLERFQPDIYVTFANIIDPFVDRVYGPNFDPDDGEDRRFIDAVAALDEAAIDLGLVTPTHLLASFRGGPAPCRYPRGRSPERTVRIAADPPYDRAATPARSAPNGHQANGPEQAAVAAGLAREAAAAQSHQAAIDGLRADAQAARDLYRQLRSRKVVRVGLALTGLRARLGAALASARRVR